MTYNASRTVQHDIQRTTHANQYDAAMFRSDAQFNALIATAAARLHVAAQPCTPVRHCEVAARCRLREYCRQWPGWLTVSAYGMAAGLSPVAVQMWSAEASRSADVAAVVWSTRRWLECGIQLHELVDDLLPLRHHLRQPKGEPKL